VLLHLTDETQIRVYSGWNDGAFSNVTWAQMKILAPVVSVGLLISLFSAWRFRIWRAAFLTTQIIAC